MHPKSTLTAEGEVEEEPPAAEELDQRELAASLRDGDVDTFFFLLDSEYREKLIAYIKKTARGRLDGDPQSQKDIYQTVLMQLLKKVREPGFSPTAPLRMAYTIAHRRTVDHLRGLDGPEKKRTICSDLLIDNLAGTQVGRGWTEMTKAERAEFNQIVCDSAENLPRMQAAALGAFWNLFPELGERDKHPKIAREMSDLLGEHVSSVRAKSALKAAIEKVRMKLKAAGFGPPDES